MPDINDAVEDIEQVVDVEEERVDDVEDEVFDVVDEDLKKSIWPRVPPPQSSLLHFQSESSWARFQKHDIYPQVHQPIVRI